ncbi:MAG TPA: hypothetical protein VLA11_09320 [Woeseiaceae bacterium]|jgi:hypothetical protein|nr:hypothetical protein [Woeseiaceae bacterium]
MLDRLRNWIKTQFSANEPEAVPDVRKSGAHASPRPAAKQVPRKNPEFVEADDELAGDIDSLGPGKNVLIRNKYVREDTGTHETLKILDDSLVDSGEETGIDPYNTGGFDRSRNWDKRFGK